MNIENISTNIVEWDGIARDVLMVISVLALLLNAYFVTHGWIRRSKTRNPSPFSKAAFITSASVAFLVLIVVTWMLSRAFHTAVRVRPSLASVSMLWTTIAFYLEVVAMSLPSIACGIIGGIALGTKSSSPHLHP